MLTESLAVIPTPVADERELIARVRQGDPSAWRIFYDSHVDAVHRAIYRLVRRSDWAAELSQDVFVKAFEHLSTFRGASSIATWLRVLAARTAIDELRRQTRERRHVVLDCAAEVPLSEPRFDPILRDRIAAAIDGLPERLRLVFVMHDLEGFTHNEIGTLLDVPAGTVRRQVSEARAALRPQLAILKSEDS